MMEWLNKLDNELNQVDNERKVYEIKNIYLKSYIEPLTQQLKTATDKKAIGLEIKQLKDQIESVVLKHLNRIKTNSGSLNANNLNKFNGLDLLVFNNGNRHLINQTIQEIANFFKAYNFEFINGDEIISDLFNFENLNIDKDHPARANHDSFYLSDNLLLRTHCTSNSAKVIYNNPKDDIRIFSYGNVYRKDEDDATHSHQFNQIDIVWLKSGFSLANLKYLIDELIKYLFGSHLKTRYRLSYFPFTEPSFEVDVECFNCLSKGCSVCKHTGWIEILGAGMLHQNVINKANIKNINSGLAAGIGIERIVMLKYKITDIRDLYTNDFDFNKQFIK